MGEKSRGQDVKSLKYWLQKIESIHLTEIDLGLERVSLVADKMNLLTSQAQIVLIAGTNGKGSCAATLEALAISQNKKVGCYTSPHLLKFNERIRIDGEDISDERLIQAFESIESIRGNTSLTFFEYTTLAALWAFSRVNLDLIILEVGLGGRLDAVNMMQADISIVTSIAKDHQDWLGNDLLQIAYEKSGIFSPSSVNLVGDSQAYQLILEARPELLAKLESPQSNDIHQLNGYLPFITSFNLLPQNVDCALAAFSRLFALDPMTINFDTLTRCFRLKGRFQTLATKPLTIVDVAHNPQAINNLVENLSKLPKSTHRYAICGLMKDKAIKSILEILEPAVDQCIFVDLDYERAACSDYLLNVWQNISNKKAETASDVAHAYQRIVDISTENTQIIVFGSFITVAAMLQYDSKLN